MAVKVSQSPVREVPSSDLVKAKSALDDIQGIQTSEKIIPRRLFIVCPRVLTDDYFTKYGDRPLLKYIKLLDRTSVIRAVAIKARDRLSNIKYEDVSRTLAVAKFGIGKCDEIAWSVVMKARKLGIKNLFIICAECPPLLPTFKSSANHGFAVFGEGVKEALAKCKSKEGYNQNLLTILEKLKGATILDGYLHPAPISAERVRECADFVKYIEALNITKIVKVIDVDDYLKEPNADSTVCNDAERIYNLTKEVLPRVPHSPSPDILKHQPRICADFLTDKIPDTKWSKNADKQKIWFEGTEEKAIQIAKYLKANGVDASEPALAKTGNWLVIVSNPDFDLIEKLPPFEKGKEEKTSVSADKEKKGPKGSTAAPKKKKKR